MKPATAGGPYKVPRQNEGWRPIALAVAIHALLLLFLWVGVSWQNNEPTEVQAEIWDMKVQDAAPAPEPTPKSKPEPEPEPEPAPQPVVKAPPPPPVEAPPTPKEPDIALERLKAKKKLEERKLAEAKEAKLKKEADEKLAELEAKKLADKKLADKKLADKKLAEQKLQQEKEELKEQLEKEKKELADKEKKKAATEKLAKEKAEKADKAAKDKAFAAEMSRITGSAAKGATGTAAQSTGGKVDGGYASAIRSKVKGNLVYGASDDSLTATYKITQLPTGEIINVRKVKGSASAAYDAAIENAIAKSSPLPKKKDGTVERELELVFNMKDMH